MARANNAFTGYISLLDAELGTNLFYFSAADSRGNEASTPRIFDLPFKSQLLLNGDFEAGKQDWTGNYNLVNGGEKNLYSFLGDNAAFVQGSIRQEIDLRLSNGAVLSYWIAARDQLSFFDGLSVNILDENDDLIDTLIVHDFGDDWIPRPARSNGYFNFKFSLNDYVGQEISLQFRAINEAAFLIDHVVIAELGNNIPPPEVRVLDFEDTFVVKFDDGLIDTIRAAYPGHQVDIMIDDERLNLNQGIFGFDYYNSITELGNGAHTIRVVAIENNVVSKSGTPVYLVKKQVNQLLLNRGFEDNFEHWLVEGDQIELNEFEGSSPGLYFYGERSIQINGSAGDVARSIEQTVSVPFGIKTLEFSARVRMQTDFDIDTENLFVDLLDINDVLLESHAIAKGKGILDEAKINPASYQFYHHLVLFELDAALLQNKTIKLRIRHESSEDDSDVTFHIDNLSLFYTNYGVQLNLN